MRKRILKAALVLAVTAGTLATAGVAQAHTSSASMTCQGGLVIDGVNFVPNLPNHVYWKIDNQTPGQAQFAASFHKTVANPDKTVGHSWQVQFTAGDDAKFDHFMSGTVAACVEGPPTTTTIPATTTTVVRPTTTTTIPAPTTTAAAPVTTVTVPTSVLIDLPPVVVSVPSAPVVAVPVVNPPLPRTGVSAGDVAWVAAAVSMLGALCLLTARRKRSTTKGF